MLGGWVAEFYRRKARVPVVQGVLGSRMRLDPMEHVDGQLLFVPQIYDRRERAVLRHALRPGDVFLDVSANIGFYSLFASPLVGPQGRVYAFDADPYSVDRLKEHIRLNNVGNVVPIHAGISDREEVLKLGINLRGYRGSSSFLTPGQDTLEVRCCSLLRFVREFKMTRIRAAKVDIEGFGLRVLARFLADADPSRYPQVLIVEKEEGLYDLLASYGYQLVTASGLNWALERRN